MHMRQIVKITTEAAWPQQKYMGVGDGVEKEGSGQKINSAVYNNTGNLFNTGNVI